MLGDRHPQTLISMYNNMTFLVQLNQLERAEELVQECVEVNVVCFCAEHCETKEAKQLLEEVNARVKKSERVRGEKEGEMFA